MFRQSFGALALAVMAFLAVPAAASAHGTNTAGTVEGPVIAGSPVTVSFAEGAFAGGEKVSFEVSGFGDVTLAVLTSATATLVTTADADGAVSAVVTPPENAEGTYEVTATGLTSGNIGTAAPTIASDDANGNPAEGSEMSGLVIWAAAGTLALGAALVAVLTIVRRQRHPKD